MRILFLTNKAPYPPKDGGSIATLNMIEAFADSGHHATVLAMNTRKHHISPYEIPDDLSAKIIFHLVELPAKINVVGLIKNLFFSKLPYNAVRFIDRNYQEKIKSLLKAYDFDIVQLEGLYLTPYISTIKKYSKALVAYRSHNIEHEIWERTVVNAAGVKKIYLKILTSRLKKFEQNALNKYDLLIPITKRDEQKLKAMGNTKPSLTIPAGFGIPENAYGETDFEMNLFFIGALDWTPNQEGLIWFLDKCWPSVLKKRPQTQLKIAGRNAPKWLIERLNIDKVDYLGEIDDAHQYICKNGIMIAPLLSGSGMRVKIIEGMLYHKAIVTTSVGCEGIRVKDREHLFIANTPEKFSSDVLALLSSKKKVIETGAKAALFVEANYNIKHITQKLIAFYNSYS
jgi:glycosyltransferase involved in cell wall biosynthesis